MTPNIKANEKASYHQFRLPESDLSGEWFGSFEVFWANKGDLGQAEDGSPEPSGWYWQSCQPGCLPDGDAIGPFDTSEEAYDAAQNF
jgi:hypothetical protein